MTYVLDESFDGNTCIKIGNDYLRPNNTLGGEKYWWGGKTKALDELSSYFRFLYDKKSA